MFKFEIIKKSKKSKARVGKIITPHGNILTPAFIPVATLGVIKAGLSKDELDKTGIQCQITNSWHFLDLDRIDIVAKVGGLHKFFNFNKPIFTDSGGFQVFSLGKGREFGIGKISSIFIGEEPLRVNQNLSKSLIQSIDNNGIVFKSPRDGRKILFTPEISADIQYKLGADFIYVLDICGTPLDDYKVEKAQMEFSHKWYKRFLKVANKNNKNQKIFGIVQGGEFQDLREASVDFVNKLPVFGIAIGGALGKTKKDMFQIISWVNKKIDFNRPHHLLGMGDIDIIDEIIKSGIDLFDCAFYTRLARHGTALTAKGHINVAKSKFRNVFKPIDKKCECPVCQNWTLAQINFLFKAKEMLAGKLVTIHNLYFLEKLLEKIRARIGRSF